jgi:Helix-turn-helix domain
MKERLRTDEDTIDLLRRLAVHYPDTLIAGILNRQGRRTARGLSFTASRVQSLRHHHNIPCYQPDDQPQEGPVLTVADAAAELGVAPSTLHRWLSDGFIAGEQITPGAPWRIRLTNQLRALFVDDAPDGAPPRVRRERHGDACRSRIAVLQDSAIAGDPLQGDGRNQSLR